MGFFLLNKSSGGSLEHLEALRGKGATNSLSTHLAELDGDVEGIIKLADNLLEQGYDKANPQIIIKALSAYNEALKLDPSNESALLSMTRVSADVGLVDKTILYGQRYLNLKPNDFRARADLGAALVMAGEIEKGKAELEKVLLLSPEFFPATLAMAMAQKQAGEIDSAKSYANLAIERASNEEQKDVARRILDLLDSPKEAVAGPGIILERERVEEFIRSHPILGKKVEQISVNHSGTIRVSLKNFPIEKMPEVAKTKLQERAKAQLGDLKNVEVIQIIGDNLQVLDISLK